MGELVVHQFVSVDGFAADDDAGFSLFADHDGSTDELDNETLARLESVDAILLGANTYRMFAAYWPTPDSDAEILAPRINELPKIVFSTSLSEAPWGEHEPAMVVSDDAVEAIRRLKHDLPGDLVVWGSLTLTDALFSADLVDVVRLVVVPRVLGSGRTAFPAGFAGTRLRHSRTGTFDSGLVVIEYQNERNVD
jgi:dihydrofolate reductase